MSQLRPIGKRGRRERGHEHQERKKSVVEHRQRRRGWRNLHQDQQGRKGGMGRRTGEGGKPPEHVISLKIEKIADGTCSATSRGGEERKRGGAGGERGVESSA